VRGWHWLAVITLFVATGCASPRERAYQQAVRDYKRNEAEVAAFARTNVKQLVAATKTFRTSVGRWPQTFIDFGRFVLANNVPLDLLAFNDVTFATLEDGSVQIHYDVNCSRFINKQYQFTQTGTVNVKVK
jgi:hypothetical protein